MFTHTKRPRFVISVVKCSLVWFGKDSSVMVSCDEVFKWFFYLQNFHLYFCFLLSGCSQNYHKRCVVKIPNNCSRPNDTSSRRSSTLQPPRSPSGGSTNSLISEDAGGKNDSGTSLVKRMSDLMNDIIKN